MTDKLFNELEHLYNEFKISVNKNSSEDYPHIAIFEFNFIENLKNQAKKYNLDSKFQYYNDLESQMRKKLRTMGISINNK